MSKQESEVSDVSGKLGVCEVASRSHPWRFMKEGRRPGPEGPGFGTNNSSVPINSTSHFRKGQLNPSSGVRPPG